MQEVTFYNADGKVINELFQWDLSQNIILKDWAYDYAPELHFINRNSEEALVVQSSLENSVVTCEIPNSLLREPYTITVYGYYSQDDESENSIEVLSGKTIFISRINVVKRPRPSDYVYEDDKNVISLVSIMKIVQQYAAQVSDDKTNVTIMKNEVAKMKSDVEQSVSTFDTTYANALANITKEGASQIQAIQEAAQKEKDAIDESISEFNDTYPTVLEEINEKVAYIDEKYEDIDATAKDIQTMSEEITKKSEQALGDIANAGTEQATLVNSAGTEQVELITTTGEGVLASIPEDYTTLSQEVEDLKTELEDVKTTLNNLITAIENGEITAEEVNDLYK